MGKMIYNGVNLGGATSQANQVNFDDTNTQLGVHDMQSAIEAMNEKIGSSGGSVGEEVLTQANTYTDEKVSALVNGAPETMNTLKELADAMAENDDVVDALNAAIGNKANQSDLDAVNENLSKKLNAENPTFSGFLNSDTLETSNKQVAFATGKSVYIGNAELESLNLEYGGKSIPVSDFALNSDLESRTSLKLINTGGSLVANTTKEFSISTTGNLLFFMVNYNGAFYTFTSVLNTAGRCTNGAVTLNYTYDGTSKIITITSNVNCTLSSIFSLG